MIVDLHKDDCKHWQFYADFLPGKELAAVDLTQPTKFNDTARNRYNYCVKHGYTAVGGWDIRNSQIENLYRINTSSDSRQGRPMHPAYFEHPTETNVENTCPYHQIRFFAVLSPSGDMVAYAICYFVGEVVNISTILGHTAYMKDGIMLLLMRRLIDESRDFGAKLLVYYLWISGKESLTYFKHSVGFKPMRVNVKP